MNFTYTKKVTDLIEQLTVFMDKYIYQTIRLTGIISKQQTIYGNNLP